MEAAERRQFRIRHRMGITGFFKLCPSPDVETVKVIINNRNGERKAHDKCKTCGRTRVNYRYVITTGH